MHSLKTKLGKTLIVYLGGSWVVVEASDFIIGNYDMDRGLINLVIILVIFGLFGTLIFTWFDKKWNKWSIPLQVINLVVAIFTMGYFVMNPTSIDPSKLRVIKLSENKLTTDRTALTSIAILPFSNFMGNEEQDYLLSSMHEGLISEIGKLSKLRTISRTSVQNYSKTKKSIKEIAIELNVDAIMEASVSRVDTMVEVRLKLFRVDPEEAQIWSHEYKTSMGQIPNLYREVTKNVATNLLDALTPKETKQLNKRTDIDPIAYDLFLQASYYIGHLTNEGYEKAHEIIEKSIELDSTYASSYVGLAFVTMAKKQMGLISTREADPVIRYNLVRALQLDPNHSNVYGGLAALSAWTDWDWVTAEQYFKKSLELNPNEASMRASYAHFLMIRNRWDEAWEQMHYAMEIDPESPWVVAFSGVLYFQDEKLISGFKQFEKLHKMIPHHNMVNWFLAKKYFSLRQYDKSIKHIKIVMENVGMGHLKEFIDETYKNNDYPTTMRTLAEALEKERESRFVAPSTINQIYHFYLGDKEKTIYWMQQMYAEKDPNLPYSAIRGGPNTYQDDPRYIEIMEEMGLW